ncbi:MAG: gamma carbonic anhydrase family protein [Myxococcales bacterium]|nr:gamma carbonic anhydrase family protein [Myxococcales bacterium]
MDEARSRGLVLPFDGKTPVLHPGVFLAPTSVVVGDVELGEDVSVWFHTVVRGDVHRIRVGRRTNLQDLVVVHVTYGTGPTTIGEDVTVGHGAVVHAATIGDRCLVGIRAVVLDGARIGEGSIVGAGALVPPGMEVPAGSVVMGVPAKVVRKATEADRKMILELGRRYLDVTVPGYR